MSLIFLVIGLSLRTLLRSKRLSISGMDFVNFPSDIGINLCLGATLHQISLMFLVAAMTRFHEASLMR